MYCNVESTCLPLRLFSTLVFFWEGRIKTTCNLSSTRALPVGHYQSKKNERIKSPYQR